MFDDFITKLKKTFAQTSMLSSILDRFDFCQIEFEIRRARNRSAVATLNLGSLACEIRLLHVWVLAYKAAVYHIQVHYQ